MHFSKYHGTGNDFVLIDNRSLVFDAENSDLIKSICDRHFGVGADGLMLLQNVEGFDFEMVYFNSDGNTSSMCGNGGRCIVQFALDLGVVQGSARFKAIDGSHEASIHDHSISLAMNDVSSVAQKANAFVLDTGSPHFVTFKKDVFDNQNFVIEGRETRYSEEYMHEGINVNHVEILNNSTINSRTYERGVENETLSCGTGAVACAVSTALELNLSDGQHTITVNTPGGELQVGFNKQETQFSSISLIGPAVKVFKGELHS